MKDPFTGGVGTPVYGERFVGRNQLVQQLREDCTRKSFAIQGLPHTGKTSLVQHSIIYNSNQVVSNMPLCIIYLSVDTCTDKVKFFKELVTNVYEKVRAIMTDEDDICRFDRIFQLIEKKDYEDVKIKGFFEQTISRLRVNVVIILDRFDHIKKQGFAFCSTDFSILSSIISPANINLIVISIRSIDYLEKEVGKEAGSVFSQLFLSTTIVLKQFSNTEMDNYWARLIPYYDAIGLTIDENYKKTALYYAGCNPFLLDTYNNLVSQIFRDAKIQPALEDLHIAMKRIYNSHINSLIRDNLLNMAIQVILGPVYDINDDKMNLLKQYDFLRIIDEKEKRTLIGHDLGLVEQSVDGKGTIAYAAPSDYFTLLFKKDYASTADFWKEWSATFRSLQLLCKDFLEVKWGDKWPDHIEEEAIRQMQEDAKIDKNANITESPLIEYLRETSIGNLIDKYWNTFAPVFEPMGQYKFRECYNYVKRFRNHHAHNNTRFLSESDKEKANEYLEDIGKKVNSWHQSGRKLKLSNKDTVTSTLLSSASHPSNIIPKPTNGIVADFPKPNAELKSDEYLGKIFRSKNCVHIKDSWVKIDNKNGYREDCSKRKCDYQEGEWVICKQRLETRPDGKTSNFAIDIHPAEH